MNNLVIGRGEVGIAIAEVLDCESYDLKDKGKLPKADVLHICFPYSETFITDVQNYVKETGAGLAIVYSTVPIGTCKQIPAVHSPVEGKHPDLVSYIRTGVRWLGSDSKIALLVAANIWEDTSRDLSKSRVRELSSSDYTEFLKLRSTAKYGVNLAWTDYEKNVADKIGMDFELLKEFDSDYNELYRGSQFQRYILDPPNGRIGGHCIVPNAELLDKQFPNDMLKMIKGMK